MPSRVDVPSIAERAADTLKLPRTPAHGPRPAIATRRRIVPIILVAVLCIGILVGLAFGVAGGHRGATSTGALTATATPLSQTSPDGPIPAAIAATVQRGPLAVTLSVTPPAVGTAAFVVRVTRGGTPVTAGQVRIRLWMPAWPSLGVATLQTTRAGDGYQGQGTILALGRWRAEVIVQSRGTATPPVVPFDSPGSSHVGFTPFLDSRRPLGCRQVACPVALPATLRQLSRHTTGCGMPSA